MLLSIAALVVGLVVLVWSADRFVAGSAATARHMGLPSLLIGMVIVGFGTSAPELVVSALASLDGNPGLSLGNAYGSNIANITLILGAAALIRPISVRSDAWRKELPILMAVTMLAAILLWDGRLTRTDALIHFVVFAGLMGWSTIQGLAHRDKAVEAVLEPELAARTMPLRPAVFWMVLGLVVLVVSSRALVWGAVRIAAAMGISDLIIGLTVVATGTSLPELASSIAAARKGEHDIALGNVLGSNLFNTLAVVGLAAAIKPMDVPPEILTRDFVVLGGVSLVLFLVGYGFRGPGRINRWEAVLLLAGYVAYTGWLVRTAVIGG
jgi:cation:H+ antiporter